MKVTGFHIEKKAADFVIAENKKQVLLRVGALESA